MGICKLLRRLPYAALLLAISAAFFSTFILTPKCVIKSTPIGEDGSCGPFGEVLLYAPYEPRFAPDGDWFIFHARSQLGYFTVVEGTQYGPFDAILPLRSKPRGESWGFVGREGNRLFVIVDREVRAAYENEGVTDVLPRWRPEKYYCAPLYYGNDVTALSNDGRHWAFKVFGDDGEYAFVNGAKFGPYQKIYSAAVSPEGDNWGLAVAIAGEEYAIVNGETYGPFGEAQYLSEKYPKVNTEIVFSDEGDGWFINPGRFRPRTSIIVNGDKYGGFRWAYDFRWSDDGGLWAVPVRRGMSAYVLVNGVEYGPYAGSPSANVSAGGTAWGACYSEGDDDFVVVNGRNYGPYEYTAEPYFSADGRNWGFKARKKGRAYKVINGEEWGPYEEVLSELWFGGTSWAFWAKKRGAWYVVVDGTEWGPYSTGIQPKTAETRILMSDVAWAFCNETEEGYYIIVDGEEYGPYDATDSYEYLKINRYGTAQALVVSKGYLQPEYVIFGGAKPGPYVKCVAYTDGDWVGFWGLKASFGNKYRLIHKEYAGAMVIDER